MIEATGITKTYRTKRGGKQLDVHALRGVDLTVPDGGAVSIIGESGCGKTTLGRILSGIEHAGAGEVSIDGVALSSMSGRSRSHAQRRVQLIHQDPYSALNPTRTIERTLGDALRLRAGQTGKDAAWVRHRMWELLTMVGLDADYVVPRYPHQLSGGMRQRVVIARALSVDPDVLVADEAVSMIDASLRLGVLGVFRRLRSELGIAVVFVTHDVASARFIGSDGQVVVLYRGTVIEQGPVDAIIARPLHPYTQALLSAIPVLRGIEREAPDRVVPTAPLEEGSPDTGCLFAPRCPFAQPACLDGQPPLVPAGDAADSHRHACLFPVQRQVIAASSHGS